LGVQELKIEIENPNPGLDPRVTETILHGLALEHFVEYKSSYDEEEEKFSIVVKRSVGIKKTLRFLESVSFWQPAVAARR
jgi:hypothetical protein